MIYPKFINKGSKIGVPAPSSGAYYPIYCKRIDNAKVRLEEMGYKVELSKNVYVSDMCRSASAKERGEEINEMFSNPEYEALICAGGGEFLMEILDFVDFENIKKNPKWIQGFSNPTTLLFPITTFCDIATIYSKNIGEFGAESYHESIYQNLNILNGKIEEINSYELYEEEGHEHVTGLEPDNLTEKVEWKVFNNNKAEMTGRVIGGCFEDICLLAGTKYDGMKVFNERYKSDGIILCFDVCETSKEELIRSLWRLEQFEYFKYVKGIVFGRNGKEESYLGYTMENAIKDSVLGKLNIPIIYDADFSHKSPTVPIVNGAMANIVCENGKGRVKLDLV